MNKRNRHYRRLALLTAIVTASLFLILSGTMFAATVLKSRQVPTEQTLKGSTGNEKFNAIRFETFGGQPEERLIGYFLHKDDIRVTLDSPQLESVGKLNMNEVFTDHERVAKQKMYITTGNLVIGEITRDNRVIGYTLNPLKMEVTIWDVTKEPSNITLQIRYKDLQAKGDRYYGGPK